MAKVIARAQKVHGTEPIESSDESIPPPSLNARKGKKRASEFDPFRPKLLQKISDGAKLMELILD